MMMVYTQNGARIYPFATAKVEVSTTKEYYTEVYDEDGEFLGQEEYTTLLEAYDEAADIPEMYHGLGFFRLEIVDSENPGVVYYTFNHFNGGRIHEPELRELVNNRENAAKVEKSNAEIIACIDDYLVDADAAAEVEIENATNAAKAVFEEGKSYKCGVEVFTVTARGNIAVGFKTPDGNIISAKIRGTADSECACYDGMTIWAAEVVKEIFTVTTQNGETYDLPDGDFALHGNKIFDLLNHELASFDNADDAKKAADELEKAIERGDKTFTFAEVEEINAEIIACLDDYIVDIDASEYAVSVEAQEVAINAEIENAQAAAEIGEVSPSIEKIFAAVTTEIKPHIKGKYFVQIDDNWREQNVREIFATLEDAVKVARLMYSELRKVSRHIYATVEARTVDINKLWDRADDWTTFYEINSEGEKINRRETIAVIAKIDNRTVEEVRNDIGRYGDNYGFYKNSAPVEEVEAEKNPLKAKVEEILNRPRKSVIDWAGTFDDMKISEILNLQKDLKKFLKLGQIDLAENVFSMLKTLCRNYRAVAA